MAGTSRAMFPLARHCLVAWLTYLIFMQTISFGVSLDTDHCPTGCSCPKLHVVNCIGGIPVSSNKQEIQDLTIENNTITEITEGDFANFTGLKNLILRYGSIEELRPGAFSEIKRSVQVIDLSSNKLSVIHESVFTKFTNLKTLVLNNNHLEKISANTFVNMSSLVKIELEMNYIEKIEKDAFKNVPVLKDVNFFRNKLTEIPAAGLANAKGLENLDLSSNKIHNLAEHLEATLDSLKILVLDSNPIKTITVFPYIGSSLQLLDLRFAEITELKSGAWSNMGSLKVLHLSGNSFFALHSDMFRNLNSLLTLYVMDCPHLNHLGPEVFKYAPNLHVVHIARNRNLMFIDDNAFRSSNLTDVFMNSNALTKFQENLLPWSELHSTFLRHNPVVCDCQMEWVLKPGVFGNNSEVKSSFEEVECSSPGGLVNKTLMSLKPSELVCKKHPNHMSIVEDNKSRVVNGAIGALVAVVIVFSIILVVKYRRRIVASCRRYYHYKKYSNDMIFTVENDHDTSIGELDDTEGRPLKEMKLETEPL